MDSESIITRRGKARVAALAAAVGLAVAVPQASAQNGSPFFLEFDEVEIFIEINATDGDAGLQALLDAEGWKFVTIYGPDWRRVLSVRANSGLRRQGVTEIFFESSEPSFDEQPLEDFLDRFPAGEYKFFGMTVDGTFLFGTSELTHDLPDQPEILTPEEEAEVSADDDLVVTWNPVTTPAGIEIVGYEVVVEGGDPERVFSVEVSADRTSQTVPADFFDPASDYKVELIAIEESNNKTITEHEFTTE